MPRMLFKGKRIDNNEWVKGYYVRKIDPLTNISRSFILIQEREINPITGKPSIFKSVMTWYEVIPETVSRNTGVPDSKGNLLFENDIIKEGCNNLIGVIVEDKSTGGFKLKDFGED